ncbi:MAG: family transposase [Arthrobacter sp.]|nr:family transposase [Arthrobacter sp.]
MVDEVRRRVQQDTWGAGATRAIRFTGSAGPCRSAPIHLTDKQARLDAKLAAGDPNHEATLRPMSSSSP